MVEVSNKTKGEMTTERILEATAYCIATYGIEKASISRISEKAKVSRGLVAHYFPEKSKLFMDVIRHIVKDGYEKIKAAEKSVKKEEQVFDILRANMSYFFERPSFLKCFILFYYFSGVSPAYKKYNTQLTNAARVRIEKALAARTIHDKELARSIHSQLVGAMLQFHAVDHGMGIGKFSERFLKSIRNQIKRA